MHKSSLLAALLLCKQIRISYLPGIPILIFIINLLLFVDLLQDVAIYTI